MNWAGASPILAAGTGRRATLSDVAFDVTDLAIYCRDSRLPTGIQRVQLEIVGAALKRAPPGVSVTVVVCAPRKLGWVEVPHTVFQTVARLATRSDTGTLDEWSSIVKQLQSLHEVGELHEFAPATWLINLGASWGIENYFLCLRNAKARHDIRYAAFVHDCIPLTAQEYCPPQQTSEFLEWMLGLFDHADGFFTNSLASSRDLRRVAYGLSRPLPAPKIIPLDADFSTTLATGAATRPGRFGSDVENGHFVLMVSTVEPRKNHLAAFAAWLSLLRRHGEAKVPTLVCVGKRGWYCNGIYDRLETSALLQRKVLMLEHISDEEMSGLYRGCRFTLYPSHYEGWGLPVTESLCHGKVPLVSRVSSLPEAGGSFAAYFELGSQDSLVAALEVLMFDDDTLRTREQRIVEGFQTRSWTDLAGDIFDHVATLGATGRTSARPVIAGAVPVVMPLGQWLPLVRNRETRLWPHRPGTEALRQGEGWWNTEEWACWLRGKYGRLAALFDMPEGDGLVLHLCLFGVARGDVTVRVAVNGLPDIEKFMPPKEEGWISVIVPPDVVDAHRQSDGQVLADLRIKCDRALDFREVTDGRDLRQSGVAVRGLIACAASDAATRLRFLECAQLGAIDSMLGLPADLDATGFSCWADAVLPDA